MKKQFKLLSSASVVLAVSVHLLAAPVATLPVGHDGKPLNLDFETGTLKDWNGHRHDAFDAQPNHGRHNRRSAAAVT